MIATLVDSRMVLPLCVGRSQSTLPFPQPSTAGAFHSAEHPELDFDGYRNGKLAATRGRDVTAACRRGIASIRALCLRCPSTGGVPGLVITVPQPPVRIG